jgi:Uncharacterized protein conserved in bacteria (DUF2325)
LQKALDDRHHAVIKSFSRLQGEADVIEKWDEARRSGNIPGAYWAVLTHPDVGFTGMRQAFGDVHMLSHLVGATNRADIRRLTALEDENAALRSKVERQQVRLHEAITTRDTTIRQLGALAVEKVLAVTERDDENALAALHHVVADLRSRLAREVGRCERLERRNAEAAEMAQSWHQRAIEAEAQRAALEQELAALERRGDTLDAAMTVPAQRILYVGGRPGCVQQMCEVLEAGGGALLCHDGGRHDHPSLLPGLISQADRVAFPVDCVSHDAALTIKRVCRQLGKTWLPLRSSGLGSFLAALAIPINNPTALLQSER